jgi:hypothetical protein
VRASTTLNDFGALHFLDQLEELFVITEILIKLSLVEVRRPLKEAFCKCMILPLYSLSFSLAIGEVQTLKSITSIVPTLYIHRSIA